VRPSRSARSSACHHAGALDAELCGATGIRVTRREELPAAMARMFATDGPVLLHVEQDAALL
jgi:thiamine pyrophosphate-dependent acetolactate synthase large subunit-like protein